MFWLLEYVISTYLWFSQISCCYWFLILLHCVQITYFIWFQWFKIFWDLFYGLTYDISRRMFHVHLKRICIRLLLYGVFHRCLLAFSRFMVVFKSSISLLIFCLLYPLLKMKFWSHQLLLLHCIFTLQFSVFAFCILGSQSRYIYMFIIVIDS